MRVAIVYKHAPKYREAFYNLLREYLAKHDVELELLIGDPVGIDRGRNDVASIDWAHFRPNRVLKLGRYELVWQPFWREVLAADLVVVEQASKLLLNYLLSLGRLVSSRPKLAYWGHGANLQKNMASAGGEWMKVRMSRQPDWWFAYTPSAADRVYALGYASERVSVLNNTIDERELRAALDELTTVDLESFRTRVGLEPEDRVLLFLGSLYPNKMWRLAFDACEIIAETDPHIRLLVVGGGPDLEAARAAAADRQFITVAGPMFSSDKAAALAVSTLLVVPGLIGLPIVDGFNAGLPVVTLNVAWHSPEFDYVSSDENGLVLPESASAADLAVAIRGLMSDQSRIDRYRRGARQTASDLRMDVMVRAFGEGVLSALRTDPRDGSRPRWPSKRLSKLRSATGLGRS